jgi:aspartate-semialdehyde dehydrogenase
LYKIAIAGASSLLGKELKDVLSDSPLAEANFVLVDEEDAQGQLDQVGDEITFIQAVAADTFEGTDFTFFCGSEALTRKHWRQAADSGSTVIDLSGALDLESGVVIRAPWLGGESGPIDLLTPAVVPANPAALALALLMERLKQAAPVRFAAATVILPASEFGKAAMDELHQQTVSLLSFQSMPRAIYDTQVAYNLLGGLGENSTVNLAAAEARIRLHFEAITAGRERGLAIQVIHAPVFHGQTFAIAVELERPVERVAVEDALGGDHLDLLLEDTDSPSNLAATGQNDILVRLRPESGTRNPNLVSRLWLWAASDNLRLHAQNALACAMELRRLRPQKMVQ